MPAINIQLGCYKHVVSNELPQCITLPGSDVEFYASLSAQNWDAQKISKNGKLYRAVALEILGVTEGSAPDRYPFRHSVLSVAGTDFKVRRTGSSGELADIHVSSRPIKGVTLNPDILHNGWGTRFFLGRPESWTQMVNSTVRALDLGNGLIAIQTKDDGHDPKPTDLVWEYKMTKTAFKFLYTPA